jgi:hypothetical protein
VNVNNLVRQPGDVKKVAFTPASGREELKHRFHRLIGLTNYGTFAAAIAIVEVQVQTYTNATVRPRITLFINQCHL